MRNIPKTILAAIVILLYASLASAQDYTALARKLQNISANVITRNAAGSGAIIKTNKQHSWILTCGHVVAGVDTSGKTYPVRVYQDIRRGGKHIRRHNTTARVIHYSPRDGGYDLAILETKAPFGESVTQLSTELTDVGSELFHLGNMKSVFPGSFTTGYISYLDRDIGAGMMRDQTTLVEFGGSSGAGAYDKEGKFIGVVSDKNDHGISFMIPVRRVRTWFKEINFSID